MARAMSRRVGLGFVRSRWDARRAIPGMQKPHWTAPVAANASAMIWRSIRGNPFERDDVPSVGLLGGDGAGHLRGTVHEREAGAALPLRLAAVFRRHDPAAFPQDFQQGFAGSRPDSPDRTVQGETDVHGSSAPIDIVTPTRLERTPCGA